MNTLTKCLFILLAGLFSGTMLFADSDSLLDAVLEKKPDRAPENISTLPAQLPSKPSLPISNKTDNEREPSEGRRSLPRTNDVIAKPLVPSSHDTGSISPTAAASVPKTAASSVSNEYRPTCKSSSDDSLLSLLRQKNASILIGAGVYGISDFMGEDGDRGSHYILMFQTSLFKNTQLEFQGRKGKFEDDYYTVEPSDIQALMKYRICSWENIGILASGGLQYGKIEYFECHDKKDGKRPTIDMLDVMAGVSLDSPLGDFILSGGIYYSKNISGDIDDIITVTARLQYAATKDIRIGFFITYEREDVEAYDTFSTETTTFLTCGIMAGYAF